MFKSFQTFKAETETEMNDKGQENAVRACRASAALLRQRK
jgi:hypothetical protein